MDKDAINQENKLEMLNMYRRGISILVVFGASAFIFCLYVYLILRISQGLIAALMLLIACALAPITYLQIKKEKITAAGITAIVALAIAYSGNELAWKGLLPYHIVGGTLMVILAGRIFLPRKKWLWFVLILGYLCLLLYINIYEPLKRYDANESVLFNSYALTVNILLALTLFIQVMQVAQKRSIRFRMVAVMLIIVLVPLLITSAVAYYITARGTQQQAFNQITSIANLKQAEIQGWENNIRTDLQNLSPEVESYPLWNLVLKGPASATDSNYQNAYTELKSRYQQMLEHNTIFEEIFLMDPNGKVVVSTNTDQEQQIKASQPYYLEGKKGYYLNPPYSSPSLGRISMVASLPIYDQGGTLIGVFNGRINLQKLSNLMQLQTGLGKTGETYLVSQNHVLLTASRFENFTPGVSDIFSQAINDAIEKQGDGSGIYVGYRPGVSVLGVYRWIPELQAALLTEQEQSEALSLNLIALIINAGTGILGLLLAVIATVVATQAIVRPLHKLSKSAESIASGNLDLGVPVERDDEIGRLAQSFNRMTAQLQSMISGLERRVTERTKELERRSLELQVSAEVAREASSTRNLEELLNKAVYLIRDKFSFYHVGIFLLDEHKEYAILKAATGEAGQKMLEREHKLQVGEVGIVGFVTGSGQPRIALDVGVDGVYFKNPLLPETRSEMALPLKIGETVIGALDVQSSEEEAFSEEDIQVLQILADQLAVAIENARLFQEMDQALQQLDTTRGSYTKLAWEKLAQRKGKTLGYRYRGLGVEPATKQNQEAQAALQKGKSILTRAIPETIADNSETNTALAVPIKMRDQIVGVVDIRFKGQSIPSDSMMTFEEVANRLSLALESSRLYEETQVRSVQMQLLQEITSAAASQIKLQELLEEVIHRIRKGFELTHCSVFLFDSGKKSAAMIADTMDDENQLSATFIGSTIQIEGNAVVQDVIQRQKTIFYQNIFNDPRAEYFSDLFQKRDVRSAAITPITSRNEIIGILLLEISDPVRTLSEDDLLLIDQISLQISVAADVARLFEQTERRAERERLIAEITSRVRASTNVDVILKTSVQEIAQALHTDTGAILLRSSEGGLNE